MSRALPSGTITLLFTDIEGSSALWDEHRSEMALALTKHNELVSAAISGAMRPSRDDAFSLAVDSESG